MSIQQDDPNNPLIPAQPIQPAANQGGITNWIKNNKFAAIIILILIIAIIWWLFTRGKSANTTNINVSGQPGVNGAKPPSVTISKMPSTFK